MADTQGREPEVLGTDAPRLHERIARLPRRTRLLLAAGTALLLTAAGTGYALTHRPDPPPPAPADVTRVRLTGVDLPDMGGNSFEFHLRVTATAPVTVRRARTGYRGLEMFLSPPPHGTLRPGRPADYHAHAELRSCHMLPLHRGTRLLTLVVHNARGDGRIAVTPDRARFDRINRALKDLCLP